MKKALIALAALLPMAQVAIADDPITVKGLQGVSLNIYGTFDIGLWEQSKNYTSAMPNKATSAGSVSVTHSGGISPSKLGFSGDKDMGDGVKGFFTLEEHIVSTNGKDDAFGYTGMVRQSFVGFSGDFGTVIVGRQFTPAILAFAATEPRGLRESMSGMNTWLSSGDASGYNNTFMSAFASNSASYTKDLGPMHLSAMYAVGGQVGNHSANGTTSLGATYSGPITISGGWQRENQTASSNKKVEKYSLGVGVPIAPGVTIKANYFESKGYGDAGGSVETSNLKMPGIGVDWKTSAKNLVNVSFYSGKNDHVTEDKANNLVLADEYSWNSNTTFYLQAVFVNAKSGADPTVSLLQTFSQPVQNANTTAVNAGVRWNF